MTTDLAADRAATRPQRGWVKLLILMLAAEKVIQHSAVTAAFALNWKDIRSTVAISATLLMVLGGMAAILFGVGLWGILKSRAWAPALLLGLAVFDAIGEFAAQGRIGIQINVSFLIATVLLLLCLRYRTQQADRKRVTSQRHG